MIRPEKEEKRKPAGAGISKRHAAALTAGAAVSVVKLTVGVLSLSVAAIFSGLCTLCLTAAKALCRIGEKNTATKPYYAVAAMLGFAAVVYCMNAVKSFFSPDGFGFGLIPAIAIAAAAFYELGSAIVGTVKAKKDKADVRLTLKRVHLSGALNALTLAQTALLTVTGGEVSPSAAALSLIAAVVTALCAAVTFAIGKRRADEGIEE